MIRHGKVARLPAALREELNRRLEDGHSHREMVAWLNGLPAVQAVLAERFGGRPISEQNMSAWWRGGYAEWEAPRLLAQHRAYRAANQGGPQVTKGSHPVAKGSHPVAKGSHPVNQGN
ncbi:MAG: hypothetical protein JWR19_1848 [Pedosphaera sp.]|nr:hypothetical protein [Pedosphaera sp.]